MIWHAAVYGTDSTWNFIIQIHFAINVFLKYQGEVMKGNNYLHKKGDNEKQERKRGNSKSVGNVNN